MRKKEGNVDYKYFPEPNIFPIALDPAWIEEIQANMEELPQARKERMISQYKLSDYDAGVLVNDREKADFYEEAMKTARDAKKMANWVIGDISAWLNKNSVALAQSKLTPEAAAELVNVIHDGVISGKQGKEIFEEVMQGKMPREVIKEKGMEQVSDDSALLEMVNSVLDANPQSIEDYKNGKDRAIGFLVGQVMKASKGKANPKKTNEMIRTELAKR